MNRHFFIIDAFSVHHWAPVNLHVDYNVVVFCGRSDEKRPEEEGK